MVGLGLPSALTREVVAVLGPALATREIGWATGDHRVIAWDGRVRPGIVKVHGARRTFRQELHAYRAWATSLPEVPELLAAHEGAPPALVLSQLEGEPLAAGHLAPEATLRAHRDAGAWLRELHDLPHADADPLPLVEAYRRRIDAWLRRLPRGSERETLGDWLHRRFEPAWTHLRVARRVPCHRDYHARNWLVDADGRLTGVIDFEHARADHPLADFARLAATVWPDEPGLRSAFLDGYGLRPGVEEEAVLVAFAALDAVQALGWALERGDPAWASGARTALRRLGAPYHDA